MKAPIIIVTAALAVTLACSGKSDDKNAGPREVGPVSLGPGQATTSATAITGPLTAFGDGTYEIGTGAGQVPAGTYRTTIPTDSTSCYWERLRGLSGQIGDIIANGNAAAGTPVIVTIAATDKGFTARGCGTWHQ